MVVRVPRRSRDASSLALLLRLCLTTWSALGLHLGPSEPPQHPVATLFDFDAESFEITDSKSLDYYLDHIRKAGGTTMRRWLAKACELTHQDRDCGLVTEGSSLTEQRFEQLFGSDNYSVSLIHLREPVARAQSLVNMNLQARMKCCDINHDCSNHGIDPSTCNSNNLTIAAELRRTSGTCKTAPATTSPNIPMWDCRENMYVKSLVGTDRRNPTSYGTWLDIDEEDLDLAKQRLTEFEGVVITEWMGNPVVAEYLSKHVFHLDEIVPFSPSKSHQEYIKFSTQEWARVASENRYDTELYTFAKELALGRMRDAGFSVSESSLQH